MQSMLHCFATERARLWRSLQRSSRSAALQPQRSAIPHQQADNRTRPDVCTAGECRANYTRDCFPTLAHARGSTSCCEHATRERLAVCIARPAFKSLRQRQPAHTRASECAAAAFDSGNALEPYNRLPCHSVLACRCWQTFGPPAHSRPRSRRLTRCSDRSKVRIARADVLQVSR